MQTGSRVAIGHMAALSAYLIFGFNIVMTKGLTNAHIFTPLSLFTLRAVGAGTLFWLLSLFTKSESVAKRDYALIFLASMLGFFGTQITFLVGIDQATPLDCAIISTFQPVITMLVAAVVLKEPITLLKGGGVAVSLVGILTLIMCSTQHADDGTRATTPFGIVMLLLNCLCFACYLGIFRPLIQRYSVVTFMKWIFFFAFITSAPFTVGDIMRVNYAAVPAKCYAELAFLVFFATFVAYFLIPVGQKALRPTLVGLYSYVQPIIASALGIYLGMDTLSAGKLMAVAAVVAGVVMVNKSRGKQHTTTNNNT